LRAGSVFYVLRKRKKGPWTELCEAWPVCPVVDPTIDQEKHESYLLWDLNEHIAVSLLLTGEEPTLESLFGSIEHQHQEYHEHEDGFVIVGRRLAAEDAHVSKHMTLASLPAPQLSVAR
jgi:hypothetical protein